MEGPASRRAQNAVAVALDGTAASAPALAAAQRLADQLGARLSILHTAGRPVAAALSDRKLQPDHPAVDDRGARERHGRCVSAFLAASREPAALPLALAATDDVGDDRPAGSPCGTASAVIATACRPLLLVRPDAPAGDWPGLRRLLAPLDGAPSTFRGLATLVDLALRLGAALDLLVVADPASPPPDEPGTLSLPIFLDQPHHAWAEWEREVVRTLAATIGRTTLPIPAHVSAASGPAADAILRHAADLGVDAIALVRRCRFEPGRGRVLRALLARATVPLLLAPALSGPAARPPTRYWRRT